MQGSMLCSAYCYCYTAWPTALRGLCSKSKKKKTLANWETLVAAGGEGEERKTVALLLIDIFGYLRDNGSKEIDKLLRSCSVWVFGFSRFHAMTGNPIRPLKRPQTVERSD